MSSNDGARGRKKKHVSKEYSSWMVRRYFSYAIGLFFVALAISLSVKSDLGISPASSIAYVASLITPQISMGAYTALVYTLFVLLQKILEGSAFQWKNLLQVPVSIAFGLIVDGTNLLMGFLPDPSTYGAQLLYMFLGLNVMGIGYVFYLPPNIISLPSEGVMHAIAYRFKMKESTAKLIWDPLCVAVTLILSFVCLGGLFGIREGTIIAAFGNGLALKIYMKLFKERISDPLLRRKDEAGNVCSEPEGSALA